VVFHAGTAMREGQLVSSGGRILCVTTLADNLRQAQQRAYELIQGLNIDGMQYRTDIGHRALKG
jgi:phosphoribosylamine--glycine ligase